MTQFQVLHQSDSLDHGVLAVKGAIHVRDGAARDKVCCIRIGENLVVQASESETHQ